ncbi:MAG: hypothetical protein NTV14_01410, partial [Coprothermobacterota bacterium]|nr:hypothetical protein [Coprothermobacterota bacterium]
REAEEALASFLRQGMVTEDDGIYSVVHWAKRQYLSDRSSERVRHFRQKEAAQVFSPAATVAEMEDTQPVKVCDSPSSTPDETEMKRYGNDSVTTKKRFRNVSVTPPEYRVQRTEKDNPRHLAKEAARKAWRVRLRAGVDPPSLVRCAAAYAEECQRLQTPARFILHPATFLGPTLRYLDYQEPGVLERKMDHEFRGPRASELVPSDAIDRRNSGDDLNLLFLA